MYISTRRLYWEYSICMNTCMYVCIMYVCVFVLQSARHSARRSPIGALIGAMCAVDESLIKYARIENGCIYRRADSTGSAIYVCMHAYTHVLCMYVCLYSNRRAIPRSDR